METEFAFGLTKCLSLVSLSMRGARLPLPLPLACLLVPLAGESPKYKSGVKIFFLITMSLLRMIAALQKVSVEIDCSILLKLYRTNRGFPDPLWKFLRKISTLSGYLIAKDTSELSGLVFLSLAGGMKSSSSSSRSHALVLNF